LPKSAAAVKKDVRRSVKGDDVQTRKKKKKKGQNDNEEKAKEGEADNAGIF